MKAGAIMPHGGARKGAGRKPMDLAKKLGLESVPTQVKMENLPKTPKTTRKPKPPEHLLPLQLYEGLVPSPVEIFKEIADFLHYGNDRYTNIISANMIADYAMMAHYFAVIQYSIEEQKSAPGYMPDEKTAIANANDITNIMEGKRLAWKPIQDILNHKTDRQIESALKYKAEIDESWAEAALFKKSRQAKFHEKNDSKT